MRSVPAAAMATAAVLGLAACGGGGSSTLTVSAAASLKGAFETFARSFPARARFSFAGSDELAAQIRQGARPDLYAAANTTLPAQLFHAGLVERPVPFATNRLVVAVPAGSGRVHSLADLERPGVTIAAGAAGVPIGAYTRELLRRLGRRLSRRIAANIRSGEPDVAGVVGKVAQGAADAGFVYATDVAATHGRLRAIELPARARPRVAYAAAVVKGARHPVQARTFLHALLRGGGRATLRRAGFGPAPRR